MTLVTLACITQIAATFSTGIFIIWAVKYFKFIKKELIENINENTRLWKQHGRVITILEQLLLNDKALHERISKLEEKLNLSSNSSSNLNSELRTELDGLDKEFSSEFDRANQR